VGNFLECAEETVTDYNEFSGLMEAVRSGSEEAAYELVGQFGQQLLIVVRRRLGRELRQRYESADFTQIVWGSFFAHRNRLEGISTPEALAGFLAVIVRNKISERHRRLRSAKRHPDREQALEATGGDVIDTMSLRVSASKLVMADELWQQLYASTTPQGREILDLRRSGRNLLEIAEKLSISTRTVRRMLGRLKVD
jgi:RNA polymerase sigma factor (sigma-70 family)